MTKRTGLGLIAGLVLSGVSASVAQAVIISFEDFPTPGSVGSQHALIGNFYASEGVIFATPWYAYNANGLFPTNSGLNSAIGSPFPAEMEFLNPVSDVGAYFNNYVAGLTFSAFDANGLLGSVAIAATSQPTPGGPVFYELPFSGIERVTLSGGSPIHYSMDDLTFVVIPEPSTLALFGLGLAGLAAGRRRRAA